MVGSNGLALPGIDKICAGTSRRQQRQCGARLSGVCTCPSFSVAGSRKFSKLQSNRNQRQSESQQWARSSEYAAPDTLAMLSMSLQLDRADRSNLLGQESTRRRRRWPWRRFAEWRLARLWRHRQGEREAPGILRHPVAAARGGEAAVLGCAEARAA